VQGAQEWLDLLEQRWSPERRDEKYFNILSLHKYLQGRYRDGLEHNRQGLAQLAVQADYRYTILATSHIHMLLAEGDPAEAAGTLAQFAMLFAASPSEVERYELAMLQVALQLSRAEVGQQQLQGRQLAEVQGLGEALAASLGDQGRALRAANECWLLCRFGSARQCRELLFAAPAGSNQLGACRVRHAQLLLEEKRFAEAKEQFRQSIKEITWTSFLHADFVPAALLGEARAAQALGDAREARRLYETLTRNYAKADRLLPELIAAREALARLP